MTDLISRQDAIEAIMGEPTDAHYPSWYADRIKALPSAEPRTGEWIFDDEYGYYKCSECEALAEINSATGDYCLSMYCPDCGAKMQNYGADMRGEL